MAHRLNLPLSTTVCGKVRHYTKTAADAHRTALEQWEQEKGARKPGSITTYWRDQCEAYHVGHTTKGTP
jgi:hypothetical protein